MDAAWTIQRIMDNPNNRLVIHIDSTMEAKTIYGYVTADTHSFSTGASYTEIADAIGQATEDLLGESTIGNLVKGAASYVNLGKSLLGMGKFVAGSVKKWDGSVLQMPPLQLIFVALKPDDRPQDDAKTLLSMCLPGKPWAGDPTDHDLFFWAPNGYCPEKVAQAVENDIRSQGANAGYGGRIKGTCTIKIGNWFEADGLLPEQASFEFSKETTRAGNPLYVTGNVSFVPYRDVKAIEYERFFK